MEPRQTRYPGITVLSGGRKRIRLPVARKTGRMKEMDRSVDYPMHEVLKLREERRAEIRNPGRVKAAIPHRGDYATSWLLMKKPNV